MAQISQTEAQPKLAARFLPDGMSMAWLGVAPFFIFALLFLIVPTCYLMIGGFQDADGNFTLANIQQLFQPSILSAYWVSIKISIASAVGGAVIGFFLAYAAVMGGLPAWIRPTIMTFCGVASNFAGIPLAFAFLATLGRTGLVTVLLIKYFDFNIYHTGFNLLSFWGLTLTYLYFQIPLMVLILAPALDGLKREWREASAILGASGWQYWRMVALPILWPSIVGTTLLLFANSFGAIATAYGFVGTAVAQATGIDPDWSVAAAGQPPGSGGDGTDKGRGAPGTGTPGENPSRPGGGRPVP